jgi:hypothetical protein
MDVSGQINAPYTLFPRIKPLVLIGLEAGRYGKKAESLASARNLASCHHNLLLFTPSSQLVMLLAYLNNRVSTILLLKHRNKYDNIVTI